MKNIKDSFFFISHLYPNRLQPYQAVYNRLLMKEVNKFLPVTVIAPVKAYFGLFLGKEPIKKIPLMEVVDGIDVFHPRFRYIPRLFISYHDLFYRFSIRYFINSIISEKRPSHIMVGFAFPDGTALIPYLVERFGNCSLRVNGSDIRIRLQQKRISVKVLKTLEISPLIFCPGEKLKTFMVEYGVPADKIVPFRNGVDTHLFMFRSRAEAIEKLTLLGFNNISEMLEKRVILFVGNFVHVKGVDRLPEIARNLMKLYKDIVFLLVGDGGIKSKVIRECMRYKIPIITTGYLNQEFVALLMNLSDCLILPSRSEGMPNVVLEALCSGLPVVASSAGECPVILKDLHSARIVETDVDSSNFPEDFSGAIYDILQSSIDRKSMADFFKGKYSWESAAKIILETLKLI